MLSPARVAQAFDIQVDTLAAWRRRGYGPKWYRIGRQIKYAEADLLAWLSTQAGDKRLALPDNGNSAPSGHAAERAG
jgi:Helix-turn-helix domain